MCNVDSASCQLLSPVSMHKKLKNINVFDRCINNIPNTINANYTDKKIVDQVKAKMSSYIHNAKQRVSTSLNKISHNYLE